MELFAKLFSSLLAFVYHCFDRIVIHGYLSGVSRPEQVVYFFREVLGIPTVSKETLSRRTNDYRDWVESYARNHHIPIQWAEKGLRKEDHVLPALRRLEKNNACKSSRRPIGAARKRRVDGGDGRQSPLRDRPEC